MPHAHLIGLAGAGMRALSEVLLGMGWSLSGSDLAPSFVVRVLARGDEAKDGLKPALQTFPGHAAEHLPPHTDLVVHSTAIPPDNPELRRATELGIPAISYFQMLGRLMEDRHGLAIAGTHGKSTTAAMAAQVLIDAGLDSTIAFGATPIGRSSGGRAGQGRLMLVEACEYRANFLYLRPRHAAILGIEPDHFDCYDTPETLERAFAQFAALVPAEGLLIVRHDCPVSRRIAAGCSAVGPPAARKETFGLQAEADWSASGLTQDRGRYCFELCHKGRPLGTASLRPPGRHNVLNALAAAAIAHANGVPSDRIIDSLSRFPGLHRRLESLGCWGGVAVVDDYAHHPTEVAASLATIREMFPGRRVHCVFQPHQASRTQRLLSELAAALQNADVVLVTDIYRAREGPPRPGDVTAADLARQVRLGRLEVPNIHQREEIERYLHTHLTPGDVLVVMGAGDIGRIAYGFMDRFREDRAAG
jgi:UDP-N-acetylmuramate--alanine ligase